MRLAFLYGASGCYPSGSRYSGSSRLMVLSRSALSMLPSSELVVNRDQTNGFAVCRLFDVAGDDAEATAFATALAGAAQTDLSERNFFVNRFERRLNSSRVLIFHSIFLKLSPQLPNRPTLNLAHPQQLYLLDAGMQGFERDADGVVIVVFVLLGVRQQRHAQLISKKRSRKRCLSLSGNILYCPNASWAVVMAEADK